MEEPKLPEVEEKPMVEPWGTPPEKVEEESIEKPEENLIKEQIEQSVEKLVEEPMAEEKPEAQGGEDVMEEEKPEEKIGEPEAEEPKKRRTKRKALSPNAEFLVQSVLAQLPNYEVAKRYFPVLRTWAKTGKVYKEVSFTSEEVEEAISHMQAKEISAHKQAPSWWPCWALDRNTGVEILAPVGQGKKLVWTHATPVAVKWDGKQKKKYLLVQGERFASQWKMLCGKSEVRKPGPGPTVQAAEMQLRDEGKNPALEPDWTDGTAPRRTPAKKRKGKHQSEDGDDKTPVKRKKPKMGSKSKSMRADWLEYINVAEDEDEGVQDSKEEIGKENVQSQTQHGNQPMEEPLSNDPCRKSKVSMPTEDDESSGSSLSSLSSDSEADVPLETTRFHKVGEDSTNKAEPQSEQVPALKAQPQREQMPALKAFEVTGKKIGIRDGPDHTLPVVSSSDGVDEYVRTGEVFGVSAVVPSSDGSGRQYLKLADGRGFVFDRSTKEDGKVIVREVDPLSLYSDCIIPL